jgi:DNA-binding response OmpR family regulator
MKILIVEDEPDMRDNMVQSLLQEQYIVETAADYDAALEKIGVYDYDCILLDIGLPGGNGLQLLRALKQEGKMSGVIIVSAKESIDDKVTGLNEGADDYLPKPFHMAELHARVKSVIRRKKLGGNNTLALENVQIETDERTVIVGGRPLELNRKEYDILLYLFTNKGRLVTKAALAEHVWGDAIDEVSSFDFIYSQIKNLRRKLKACGAQLEIQAIYGIGYKLTEA